jgi:AcrR family transcriptional regulator
MRYRDDKKEAAICDAAIRLITANGFADTSMSKIARAAAVSPATIYVYFENKEDLLNKLYSLVKQEMGAELAKGVGPLLSVKKSFRVVWDNFYRYAINNPIRFAFTEQFANSPLVDRICKEESMTYFHPLVELVERGKSEKVFKNLPLEILTAFTFAPLIGLIKQHFSGEIVLDEKMVAAVYDLAWDAVKR